MAPVRLAVVGAGVIGRRHIEHVLGEEDAALAAVVDPSDAGRAFAAEKGAPWYPAFAAMLEAARPDGVIIATPNHLHVAVGLEAVAAGIPALVEKPIADDVAEATRLVEAAEAADVTLLTGHHRRHNPLIRAAKAAIEAGRLGRIVAVHGMCWFYKPDGYFEVEWRRQKGAGPVLMNMIHDVDLMRHLCGEVDEVQALESAAVRGFDVEDTAAVLLRFVNGALGTFALSDAIVAPWSWELTSGENPAFHETGEACLWIGGTHGSLSIPALELWQNEEARSWMEEVQRVRLPNEGADPLAMQIRNFCGVIRGTETPVVSGREGLETLRVVEAIKRAAASGRPVRV